MSLRSDGKIGLEFLGHFIELGGLKPEDRVLDIGSGAGRMALPLAAYLSRDAEYWGVDVVEPYVRRCRRRIGVKHPNFHFRFADVRNGQYHPGGRLAARTYRFPFKDQSFDFVFLSSVFTHMRWAEIENYLSEAARLLRRGRKCLVTFFLLNPESRTLIRSGASKLDFKHRIGAGLTISRDQPESALAYSESAVRGLYRKVGLRLQEPIRFGSWCGRPSFLSYQDILIAAKP